MPSLLARLIGLDVPESPPQSASPWRVEPLPLASGHDLSAVDVHDDDVGDYNVTESGWYAVDDGGAVVLGPFDSLRQCDRAIGERRKLL